MKKITQQAVNKFLNAETFKSKNTSVEVLPNVTILKLHGNAIAYRYNDPEKTLSITTCGWNTNTTRERLNSLPDVSITVKKGIQYLNGKEWDGDYIDVCKFNK
jgi:hypothetical protein